MKLVVFHPEAQEELLQEALYYNERSPTLGVRLINQIHEAIDLAAKMPGIGSPYVGKTRRVFPKDFPFSVVYQEIGDQLVVIAIASFKRQPAYWLDRSADS